MLRNALRDDVDKSDHPAIVAIIQRCLRLKPKDRPNAAELLSDPWWTAPSPPSPLSSQPYNECLNVTNHRLDWSVCRNWAVYDGKVSGHCIEDAQSKSK